MSTAIAGFLTQEGFVLAADGRELNSDGCSVISDQVQKVFPLSCADGVFAFTLSGTAALTADNSTERVVDIIFALNRSAKRLAFRRYKSPSDYVNALCSPVHSAIEEAKSSGKFSLYPNSGGVKAGPYELGTTIATLVIMGYHQSHACHFRVRFFHEDQILESPTISDDPRTEFAFGSSKVLSILGDPRDTRLSAYHGAEPYQTPFSSITEAAEIGRKYIEACSSPEGRSIDEQFCRGIGGHIHIAKVTPKNGFQWIIPPIGQTTTTALKA
jgi:hypothetical protein